jgi:hypothetical protein
MRKLPLKLRCRPRRVACPCRGVRVEDFPSAEPSARVTTALSNCRGRGGAGVELEGHGAVWQTTGGYLISSKISRTVVNREPPAEDYTPGRRSR